MSNTGIDANEMLDILGDQVRELSIKLAALQAANRQAGRTIDALNAQAAEAQAETAEKSSIEVAPDE